MGVLLVIMRTLLFGVYVAGPLIFGNSHLYTHGLRPVFWW